MYYSKNYFNLIKIFFEVIQNNSKSNNAPGLNRGLSSNYWWLRIANHMKFTEEWIICTEKHVLVKKIFTNEQNMSLHLQT